MSAHDDPAPTAAQLIAAYADDPSLLPAAERTAVEALVARDPAAALELAQARAAIAAMRAARAPAAEPDWDRMAADIGRAVSASSSGRRRLGAGAMVAGGVALAAAAALLLWWDRRPTARPVAPSVAMIDAGVADDRDELAAPTPAPDDDVEDDDEADAVDELTVEDLAGGTIDDELIDQLAAEPEPGAPDVAFDELPDAPDDRLLPDSGWVDDLSDDDLDRALEWLEANDPSRKAG